MVIKKDYVPDDTELTHSRRQGALLDSYAEQT